MLAVRIKGKSNQFRDHQEEIKKSNRARKCRFWSINLVNVQLDHCDVTANVYLSFGVNDS